MCFLFSISATMGPCKKQGIDNVIPLSGETGRLFSPLYPQTFPRNMTCTWIITVPEGNFVKLRITSLFFAYICREGTNLIIRDGQSSSSDLIKTFCGQNFESSVFSSGRHLWVRFKSSDHSVQYGSGFYALFEMVNQGKVFTLFFHWYKILVHIFSYWLVIALARLTVSLVSNLHVRQFFYSLCWTGTSLQPRLIHEPPLLASSSALLRIRKRPFCDNCRNSRALIG